jgi:hypothetical protein
MRKKIYFLITVLFTFASLCFSASPEKVMDVTYSKLSGMFYLKSVDGVMGFVDDNYHSDLGWDKKRLKLVLNQLFDGYDVFLLKTDSFEVIKSEDTTQIIVKWRGCWDAEKLPSHHAKDQFPCFGTQPVFSFDTESFQYHQWSLVGKKWKLTRVWVDPQINQGREALLKDKLLAYFIQKSDPVGEIFGKNLTQSVDSGGILMVQGLLPSCALTYVSESCHWRPDITIYGQNGWLQPMPFFAEETENAPPLKPIQIGIKEIKFINESTTKTVYTVVEKNYNGLLSYLKKRDERIYSVPRGLVFSLETTKPAPYNKKDIDSLIPMDSYFKDSTVYMQREMISNYHFMKARNYLYAKDTQSAYTEFVSAGAAGFDVEGINFNLSLTMEHLYNNATAAADYLEKEARYYPWNLELYPNCGRLNKLAGRNQKAIESYEKALRFDPENIDVLLALGDLYLENDNWQAATNKYLEVIKNDPYDHEARLKVAAIYLNHGDPAKALQCYQEALPILKKMKNGQADEIEKKVKSIESMLKKK